MSQYRSGKFPKAFKEIPHLKLWEEALWLTTPNKWSAASLYQATRTFASSMSEQMAQRFYNLVLLPRVRDDIQFYGKLNFHIYEAIMKAVFKPIAFLRGFLLPLCQEGNCSLKEATALWNLEKNIFERSFLTCFQPDLGTSNLFQTIEHIFKRFKIPETVMLFF